MSAIGQALKKLEGAIGNLEGSVVSVENSLAGVQRDMFGAPVKSNGKSNGNGQSAQGALFAQRLDRAIETVESILKE